MMRRLFGRLFPLLLALALVLAGRGEIFHAEAVGSLAAHAHFCAHPLGEADHGQPLHRGHEDGCPLCQLAGGALASPPAPPIIVSPKSYGKTLFNVIAMTPRPLIAAQAHRARAPPPAA
jgi:hypothetical protein